MADGGRDGLPADRSRGVVAARPADLADAPALAELHVRAWQAGYRGLMAQGYLDALDVADRAAAWRDRLGDLPDGVQTLVGTLDDEVTGFASFGPARDPESGAGGELYALNVHPDHWRAGVGSALLLASHDGLAALGHREATLWVVTGNDRARSFYERHAWRAERHQRTIDVGGEAVPETRYGRPVP